MSRGNVGQPEIVFLALIEQSTMRQLSKLIPYIDVGQEIFDFW